MLEKIKALVAENLGVEESKITENSSFKEDLGADSLDLFEMVMGLEEEFEIEIPTEDLGTDRNSWRCCEIYRSSINKTSGTKYK